MSREHQDRVVKIARSWIGTPYCHQASCKAGGTDCLGLIRGVWRELLGAEPVEIPAYSFDWSEPQRREDLWRGAQRYLIEQTSGPLQHGSVLLFRMRDRSVAKHLGIAVETANTMTFIHAYSGHGVMESTLTAPWRRRVVSCFQFPKEIK